MWLANSPDLIFISFLWSILGDKIDEEKVQPTTIKVLERILKTAWKKIAPETLQNLFFFISGRIQAVQDVNSHFLMK